MRVRTPVTGRDIFEVRCQADRANRIHDVAHVDAAAGANQFAFHPAQQRLGFPLVGDFEGRGHVLLQPLHQIPQKSSSLAFVVSLAFPDDVDARLTARSSCEGSFGRRHRRREAEEHLVLLGIPVFSWWVERLKKVKVEITGRCCCRTIIGCAEEKISPAGDLPLDPFEFRAPRCGIR